MQFEAQGLRERVQKVENAPGEAFDYGRFEIVVESMPDDESSTIAGKLPDDVTSAKGFDAGLWEKDAIKELLRRA
jgi:hypothetical protein